MEGEGGGRGGLRGAGPSTQTGLRPVSSDQAKGGGGGKRKGGRRGGQATARMLAARGVSLGLGKINLSDLNQIPGERALARLAKTSTVERPKFTVRKKADAKTVWAACRAVIFGCIVIAVGLAMAILGYFDKHLSQRVVVAGNDSRVEHDRVIQYHLKSMQYVGPVLMGVGTFVLIIACVITLESRDKHAQVISEESAGARAKRLSIEKAQSARKASAAARRKTLMEERGAANEAFTTSSSMEVCKPERNGRRLGPMMGTSTEEGTARATLDGEEEDEEEDDSLLPKPSAKPLTKQVHAEVHRAPRLSSSDRYAPLADLESLFDAPISEDASETPSMS